MAGDVEAEEFLLELQALGGGEVGGGRAEGGGRRAIPIPRRGHRGSSFPLFRGFLLGEHVEERVLARSFVARVGGGTGESGVDAVEEHLARRTAEIEGAGLDEVFEHALVERARVDARGEVGKVAERSVGFALGDDFLRGLLADALDAGETEADGAFAAARRNDG